MCCSAVASSIYQCSLTTIATSVSASVNALDELYEDKVDSLDDSL
jgi:hypothetical protein